MLLIALLAALLLAPGVYTALRLQARYGVARAVLAGVGVSLLGVVVLVSTLLTITPLAVVAAGACLLLALRAYDRARLMAATSWAGLALLLSALGGWPR